MRARNANAGVPSKAVVVTHSWLPYSLLAILYLCGGIGWFATMIATVGYSDSVIPGGNGAIPAMTTAFFGFINLYLFRMLCMFGSLAVVYEAERHYLSRGWAWTSWTLNTLLVLSWLATDLPFVYGTFSPFSNGLAGGATVNGAGSSAGQAAAGGTPDDSFRTQFCSVSSSYWCHINYTQGVFSVFCDFCIGLAWVFACYQLKRARGVSNLLLTGPETGLIFLTALGLIGYAIWTLSAIPLGYTREFGSAAFSYLEGQATENTYQMNWSNLIWGNYLLHAAIFASLGTAAYVSFGATTAPRMSAMIANWLSFFCILPMFIYLARDLEDFGSCSGSEASGRCPSLNGVAAGMGIVMAINFLIGLTMFAVLAQVETADFAVDMYGDKARAIDDARSTGAMPMKNLQEPAPLTSIGTGVPMQQQQPGYYGQAPLVA